MTDRVDRILALISVAKAIESDNIDKANKLDCIIRKSIDEEMKSNNISSMYEMSLVDKEKILS